MDRPARPRPAARRSRRQLTLPLTLAEQLPSLNARPAGLRPRPRSGSSRCASSCSWTGSSTSSSSAAQPPEPRDPDQLLLGVPGRGRRRRAAAPSSTRAPRRAAATYIPTSATGDIVGVRPRTAPRNAAGPARRRIQGRRRAALSARPTGGSSTPSPAAPFWHADRPGPRAWRATASSRCDATARRTTIAGPRRQRADRRARADRPPRTRYRVAAAGLGGLRSRPRRCRPRRRRRAASARRRCSTRSTRPRSPRRRRAGCRRARGRDRAARAARARSTSARATACTRPSTIRVRPERNPTASTGPAAADVDVHERGRDRAGARRGRLERADRAAGVRRHPRRSVPAGRG